LQTNHSSLFPYMPYTFLNPFFQPYGIYPPAMNSIANQRPTVNPLNPIMPIANPSNDIRSTNSSITTNPAPPFQPYEALAAFGTARRGRRQQSLKFKVLLVDANEAPQLVRQHGPLRQSLQNNGRISHEITIHPNATPHTIDDMVKSTFIVLQNGWTILKWHQRTRNYIEVEQTQGRYTFSDIKR